MLKKLISVLILGSLLVAIFVPLTASAQREVPRSCYLKRDIADCPPKNTDCNYETDPICGMCCLMQAIYNVTDWIFIIFIAIAVIFIIAGAFMFMTAGGVPEKTTAARNFILYAVIGIVVALLAKAIPAIVRFIVGV